MMEVVLFEEDKSEIIEIMYCHFDMFLDCVDDDDSPLCGIDRNTTIGEILNQSLMEKGGYTVKEIIISVTKHVAIESVMLRGKHSDAKKVLKGLSNQEEAVSVDYSEIVDILSPMTVEQVLKQSQELRESQVFV